MVVIPYFGARMSVARGDQDDDDQLMIKIAEGDQKAFAKLMSRHYTACVRFALDFFKHQRTTLEVAQAAAEDAAQEIYLKVYQQAENWQHQQATVKTWIFKMLYHYCIDEMRKYQTQQNHCHQSLNEAGQEPIIESNALAPLQSILVDANGHGVKFNLSGLSPEQRTALGLSLYSNFRYQQIAEIMGLTESAVESLIRRARKMLREKIRADTDRLGR